jgi:hypothetical protein
MSIHRNNTINEAEDLAASGFADKINTAALLEVAQDQRALMHKMATNLSNLRKSNKQLLKSYLALKNENRLLKVGQLDGAVSSEAYKRFIDLFESVKKSS